MGVISWQGNRLNQGVLRDGKEVVEDLGYVSYDEHSGKYVLWLKDTRNLFENMEYIRGDEFESMEDAHKNAARSVSAMLFHTMWRPGHSGDLPVSVPEGRTIIIQTVENMQVNQNSLGIQISSADLEKVKVGVEKADSGLLGKIFKEWLPRACTSLGLTKLMSMLFGGG